MIERFNPRNDAAWHRLRSQDITASVARALLGEHEFTTVFELWALKTGRLFQDFEETPAIKRGRLLNPITVQLRYHRVYLVAGRHRYEAAKRLKWKEIQAVELPSTDPQVDNSDLAAMAEIAENLHRREITALERSKLRAKWNEVTGKAPSVSGQVGPKLSRRGRDEGRPPSGINKAAVDLGVPASTLKRDVRIASLSPEAQEAAKSSGLDNNQSALLAAAKHKEPDQQVEAIRQRAEAAPRPEPSEPPDLIRIQDAWTAASGPNNVKQTHHHSNGREFPLFRGYTALERIKCLFFQSCLIALILVSKIRDTDFQISYILKFNSRLNF